jgi:hypothetical protein
MNLLNSSAVYRGELVGNPRGVTFDSDQLQVVDSFHFEVAQEIAAGEAANSRVYRTDINFPTADGLAYLPGVSHGGIVEVSDPTSEYNTTASVRLSATYGISPGVGSQIEDYALFTVIFPDPPSQEGN